jgi:hypothetical protein
MSIVFILLYRISYNLHYFTSLIKLRIEFKVKSKISIILRDISILINGWKFQVHYLFKLKTCSKANSIDSNTKSYMQKINFLNIV